MSYIVVKPLSDDIVCVFIKEATQYTNLPHFIGDVVEWTQRSKRKATVRSVFISFDDFNVVAKQGIFGTSYQSHSD